MFRNLIIAEIPIGFNLKVIKHLKKMVSQKKPVNQLEFTISFSSFNRTSMMLCKDADRRRESHNNAQNDDHHPIF